MTNVSILIEEDWLNRVTGIGHDNDQTGIDNGGGGGIGALEANLPPRDGCFCVIEMHDDDDDDDNTTSVYADEGGVTNAFPILVQRERTAISTAKFIMVRIDCLRTFPPPWEGLGQFILFTHTG